MEEDPRLLVHRMSWWDAFVAGFGFGLGVVLSQIMTLGTAAVLVAVVLANSR